MKKNLLILALIVFVISSCRKDRHCVCSQNGTELGDFTYTNVKRKEARDYCLAQQNTYTLSYPGASCSIK
jgi:hypothetical protein